MNFILQPLRFFAALRELAQKRLVPTELDTEQLRELDASIRRQALFSARMTQLRVLQALHDGLTGMLEGRDNLATAKLKLTDMYRALGYDAEAGGFPQDKAGTVPPARKGTLRDLASDKRMTLTITTNYRIAANQAFAAKGMEERRLYQWPAWELVRIGRVRTPRGFKRRKGGALEPVPGDDWQARFVAAGGELFDQGTRMIAPKTSDVWQNLGDGAGGYKDTLGNPFAPFAFGSKYGVREVARDECLILGVITDQKSEPDTQAGKEPAAVPAVRSKASAAGLDPALIEAMKRDLARQEDGSVRLKRQLDQELAAADKAYRARNAARNRLWLHGVIMNSGTHVGALLGWITRRMGKQQAGKAYDKVHTRKGGMRGKIGHPIQYKKVDSAEAQRIRAATGLDVAGYTHALDDSSIRHIHKQHGSKTKEKQRGQYPVTRAVIMRLHQLHSDPSTHIKLSKNSINGLPTIEYTWRRGGKRHTLVEEVRAKSLVPITMHISNRRIVAVDAPPARESPPETSETFHDVKNATSLRTRCKALVAALETHSSLSELRRARRAAA